MILNNNIFIVFNLTAIFQRVSLLKIRTLLLFTLLSSGVFAQECLQMQDAGVKLKDCYLSMNVENLWLAGHHVNWETGVADNPALTQGIKTHCSAFVASACKKNGVYILSPPQHGQVLLANAQDEWLHSQVARKEGWKMLHDEAELYVHAQELANKGYLVVAIYKNSNGAKPGHVALVMPENRSLTDLEESGPEIIMAGTHNHSAIDFRSGFKSHIRQWPAVEIEFFVHPGGLN